MSFRLRYGYKHPAWFVHAATTDSVSVVFFCIKIYEIRTTYLLC